MTNAESDAWPSVCIAMLNWNQQEMTGECLDSMADLDYPTYSVVVVDNGSRDDEGRAIRSRFPAVTVIRNDANLGFAEGNNVAIRYAMDEGAKYVLLLNNDTVVDPQMLKRLIEVAESDERIAMVGPKIYYFDEPWTIWSAGGMLEPSGLPVLLGTGETDEGQHESVREVDWITGCALLVKSGAVRRIGLLDARYFAYFEDNDWCCRARQGGFKIVYVPQAHLWHKIRPRQQALSPHHVYLMSRNRLLFLRKGGKRLLPLLSLIVTIDLRTVLAWSIHRQHRESRPLRRAVLRGVYHFLIGRFGEPPADLCAGETRYGVLTSSESTTGRHPDRKVTQWSA